MADDYEDDLSDYGSDDVISLHKYWIIACKQVQRFSVNKDEIKTRKEERLKE